MCVSVEPLSLTSLLSLSAVNSVGYSLVGLLSLKNCLKLPFGAYSTTIYSGPEEREMITVYHFKNAFFLLKKTRLILRNLGNSFFCLVEMICNVLTLSNI